ncbi:MAG TPA: chromosome segregation protein SMC [Chloroflexota bacterium]|jgi:chromosome segregation protein
MYLKQLELVGFKSFPQRTRLVFEPGITAIVGPNGSGKSNVADAVRWALGEQSMRALRGRRGEDVIFVGGGAQHPLGMAEVTLLLDNADERIPLPVAEVAIARRLYRSGEGEYLANGNRVRLRDVTEWLLGAGLGPDSYCVVGQGTIEQLVLQRPEDRRVLLEDAADVRRHALRLAETEQKLAATAANLERARDLAAALAPEVERLRHAARRAERRARVCAEAAGLAAAYYGSAEAQAEAQVATTAAALADATARGAALERELSEVETARAADEAARRPREVRLATLREQLGRLRAERERLLREQAVLRERLAGAAAREAERRAAGQALTERVEAASAEAQALAGAAMAAEAQARAAHAAAQAAREAAQAATAPLAAARRERDGAQRAGQQGAAECQRLEQAVARGAARRDAGASALAGLRTRREQAAAALAAAEGVGREREAAASAESAARAQREGELAAEVQARHAADEALRAAQGEADTARAAVEAVRARREALERVLAAAPELVATAELHAAGAYQLLGALLRVEGEHQAAIAAALDAAAHHVVVAEMEGALAGLRLVVERDAPRVVFATVAGGDGQREREAARFREQAAAALADLPGWRLAIDLVEADAAHLALCARYLGTTLVVDTLAHAVAVHERLLAWPGRAAEFQVVTRDGAVVRSAGEWAGGRDGRDAHLLAYQREARALEGELAAAAEAARVAVASRVAAEDAARVAAAAETRVREALAVADDAAREAEHAHRAAAQEAERLRRELDGAGGDLAREEQAQAAVAAETARAEEALAAASAAQAGHERALAQAFAALDGAERAAQSAITEQSAADAALAVATADARAAREVVARATAERDRLSAEREALLAQAVEAARLAGELAAQVERVDRRLAAANAELGPLQAEQRTLQDAGAAAGAERTRLDDAARRLQRELRAADEARAAATVAAERAADALSALRREHAALLAEIGAVEAAAVPVQLTLGENEGSPAPPNPLSQEEKGREPAVPAPPLLAGEGAGGVRSVDLDALRRRLSACQRELRAVGAVDPAALDDYRAAVERQEDAQRQLADLEAASVALRGAGAELQARMRKRFEEAFAAVDAAFGECFRTLFGGGSARLELTADEDSLSAGVDVIAQPPGKRTHSLHTLSGGERALTAVALLFALLRVHPSPFCVLDEVDAALDEANVQRFARLLRAQAAHTQFLVITHNRGTMETANALYGVTMVDNAISQVVSLRLADIPAAAPDQVVN